MDLKTENRLGRVSQSKRSERRGKRGEGRGGEGRGREEPENAAVRFRSNALSLNLNSFLCNVDSCNSFTWLHLGLNDIVFESCLIQT